MSFNRSNSSTESSSGQSSSSGANSSNNGCQVSCIICSERYKATDQIYAGNCGHVFHWDCLQRWWQESRKCPICRNSSDDYIQIYLNFEELGQSQNQQQNQILTTSQSQSSNWNDYENLVYEAGLYRDEIEYLNSQIKHLTFHSLRLNRSLSDSD